MNWVAIRKAADPFRWRIYGWLAGSLVGALACFLIPFLFWARPNWTYMGRYGVTLGLHYSLGGVLWGIAAADSWMILVGRRWAGSMGRLTGGLFGAAWLFCALAISDEQSYRLFSDWANHSPFNPLPESAGAAVT